MNKRISYTTNEVKLNSGAITVKTPRKPGLGWPSDLDAYTSTEGVTKYGKASRSFLDDQ